MADFVPLVGPALDGAHWTPRDAGAGAVGRPVWGPRALALDLELRLGLPPLATDPIRRLVALRARAAEAGPGVFFARSLAADPWGTARELGRMLDAIVDAGWPLDALPDAGPRVRALATLARELPPGEPDRLARIERHLATDATPPYDAIELAEDPAAPAAWSGRWRRVFDRLASVGVPVLPPRSTPAEAPGDLGRIQRLLAGGAPEPLEGDGSVVLVGAPTPEPLADAIAALVAATPPDERVVIVRGSDPGPLDAALSAHGEPRLGGARGRGAPIAAAWLPLVIALARAPFDAEAALDLLLMPDGGLPRHVMSRLAYALGDVPGPEGPRWVAALAELAAEHPEHAARLGTWLAPIGGDRLDVAPLAERVRRIDQTLGARARTIRRAVSMRGDGDDHPAAADALDATREAFAALVRALPHEGDIGAGELDELLRTFGDVVELAVDKPEGGRLARVDDPAALTGPADTIIWWGFHDPGRPPRPLFHADERRALGIDDPIALAARDADHARVIPRRARRRLVLAHAEVSGGQPRARHPLESELRGRLGARDALDAIRVSVAELRERPRWGLRAEPIPDLVHAPARTRWDGLPPVALPETLSVTGLERLLRCPLQFVLDGPAVGLRERAWGGLPSRPILLGKLGHRLIERLVTRERLMHASDDELLDEARALVEREATPLARPGQRANRRAAFATLVSLVHRLRDFLEQRGLRLAASERAIGLPLDASGRTKLEGRIDLVLVDAQARPVVLDLKWTTSRPRQAFEAHECFQLAAYAHSFDPPAEGALFGVQDRGIVQRPGVLAATWERVVKTVPALLARLAAGIIDVQGVDGATALGATLGVADGVTVEPGRVCAYCRMDLLCGRGMGDAAGGAHG
ncbi:MAG: PD-(D/E)XK nuclease family protein [Deltaproteobacteria bacterium]|nr:PD-(D/E)XK nuclease family protein [Deltaproteobacteria bacterium]